MGEAPLGPQGTAGSVWRHAGLWSLKRGEGVPGTQRVEASDAARPSGSGRGLPVLGIVCPGPRCSTFRARTRAFQVMLVPRGA